MVGERAINFETDQGHRGAEVLQRSWELFFFFFFVMLVYIHTSPHWFRLIGIFFFLC